MTRRTDTLVSVVAVTADSEKSIAAFVIEASKLLDSHYSNHEIVVVDDASTDRTREVLDQVMERVPCVRVITLSRRMGPEIAVAAGLDSAIGDVVVTIQPDFDPVTVVPEIVDSVLAGHDFVVGVTDTTVGRGLAYKLLRKAYYVMAKALVPGELVQGATMLRGLSRRAVNALTSVRRRRRQFSLLAADVGFGAMLFEYERDVDPHGKAAGYGILEALHVGASALVHASTRPIRIVSILGIVGSVLSMSYGIYAITVYAVNSEVAPGWTTLSLQVSGLFTLVFMMLALLGEYVAGVLDEAQGRPMYYVRDETTSSIMLSDPERGNVLVDPIGTYEDSL